MLKEIIDFNANLNYFDYGIFINQPIYEFTEEDFNNYKTVDFKTFEKYRCGVCWDYVMYEANIFNKRFPDIPYETYFYLIETEDNIYTHTFLLFEWNNKIYWFESSWEDYIGVQRFNSKKQALAYIQQELTNFYKAIKLYNCLYDATDEKYINISPDDYINYMDDNLEEVK